MADREQREIRFHHVFDSTIMMIEKCTVAVKDKRSGEGIFFMNLPIVVGEKIFILGAKLKNCIIKIGLTNKDPKQIKLEDEREGILNEVLQPNCLNLKDSVIFYACISLNQNGSLEFTVPSCKCRPHILNFPNLSTHVPIWLVFVLPEFGRFLEISKEEITNSAFKRSQSAGLFENVLRLFP